jgi:hypothetical protein
LVFFFFLKWFIKWSLEVQDGNHLVVNRCFFIIPFIIQDQDLLVATRCFFVIPFTIQDQDHLVAIRSFNVGLWRRPIGHQVIFFSLPSWKPTSCHQIIPYWTTRDDLMAVRFFIFIFFIPRNPSH